MNIENDGTDKDNKVDYAQTRDQYAERVRAGKTEGTIRHLIHNQNLHAEAQIRKHGGHQLDMFADNDTGLMAA